MYKKKNRLPLYITIVVVVLVLGALLSVNYIKKEKERQILRESQKQETEEIPVHDVLLYKTNAASIVYEKEWLKQDTDTEAVLQIQEDTLVTMMVTPKAGYYLKKADIVDYNFHPVNNFLRETDTDAIRVNFVMPQNDIIIDFEFARVEETESEQPKTELQSEEETEEEVLPEAETEAPFGLSLHGVTPEIILSFAGQFDDRTFLRQLGEELHVDSARSKYRTVTDVTFSTEAYVGEQEPDCVYHYIYFNNDPKWKVLSTYQMLEDTFFFTEVIEEESKLQETETEVQQSETGQRQESSASAQGAYQTTSGSGNSGGSNSDIAAQTITTTTTFDILKVSKKFLAYVGGEDSFYQQAFEYVLAKGLTGKLVGTMSSYEIISEKERAEFQITLNTGEKIEGSYEKKDGKFTFSGL